MPSVPYQNADGLQVAFGNYWADRYNFVNKPRLIQSYGPEKVLQIDYDLTKLTTAVVSYTADLNNDGTVDGFSLEDACLPAYASVTRVIILPSVAAAGGTSIILGTYQLDGTVISANSLITTTAGAKTALDTKGARCYGDGALLSTSVETASVGANNAYLAFTADGTFTAGAGKIYIYYIENA